MFCNQLRLLIVLNPPPVYNPRGPREDEVHIRSFWHRYRYHGRMVTRLGLEISRGCSWRGGRKRSGTTILRSFPTPTPVALPLVGMSLDPSQLDALWPGANRRSTPGASTKRSQGTEYAGQAQTFCKWNLGTRGETRMQSYWRGGWARSESAGGLEHGGGSPLGPEPEPEPIAQPRQLPITRLPPIPPVPFPKTRSHCAAQMWCSLCQSLEDRKGTRISS